MELFLGMFSDEWERRRAAILHDRGRLSAVGKEEEEWLRSGSAGSAAVGFGGDAAYRRGERGALSLRARYRASGHGADRAMAVRLAAVAGGSQAAVVKLASYGGSGRTGAMLDYVSREGRIAVENERGEAVTGREDLKNIPGEWEHLMSGRAESRDVASFRLNISGDHSALDNDAVRDLAMVVLGVGLGDRRHAFAVSRTSDGAIAVEGLAVLRSPSSGERLTADEKATEIVQGRLDHALSDGRLAVVASLSFRGYGNGVEYATAKLRALVTETDGAVRDETGAQIVDEAEAGDLVQKTWRHEMESRKARDVMHLIMSAREGTDVDAFRNAAREFLAGEFGEQGFRYVFAVHDPKDDPKEKEDGGKRPHVHAHAIVTMKSDFGDRVETSPKIFRDWRSSFAEKARAAGIDMEMTDRREFASAPAYTKNQVRPVGRNGRTEYEGTSQSAERRYRNKREARATDPASTVRSEEYLKQALSAWKDVVSKRDDGKVSEFAKTIIKQLDIIGKDTRIEPQFADKPTVSNTPDMVTLVALLREEFDMESSTRTDFEAYEKRVETALFKAGRHVDDANRAAFDDLAGSVRELVDARREQLELLEQRNGLSDRTETRVDDAVWDDRVSRHGWEAVAEAKEIVQQIDEYREGIARIEGGVAESSSDQRDKLNADLKAVLHEAAELAARGNSFLQEMSEHDAELKAEITLMEEQNLARGDGGDFSQGLHDEHGHDTLTGDENSVPSDEHMVVRQVEQVNEALDRQEKNREDVEARVENADEAFNSEERQTDPAKQQVPRLEELQREHDQQVARERERNRDDRDI